MDNHGNEVEVPAPPSEEFFSPTALEAIRSNGAFSDALASAMESRAGRQGSSRDAAAPLPNSCVGSSVVARSKMALNQSSEDWKASKSWKDQQRTKAIAREADEEPVKFFTGSQMLPVVIEEISKMKQSICGLQYQADHTRCFVQLVVKMTQGLQGRIIFDRGNFMSSSCARQAERVQELWRAGCQLRLIRPKGGGGFACMHVKSLIFDGAVLLTGSVNMIHNGHENNKEHLYRITHGPTVAEVLADFEKEWAEAEMVTREHIDEMIDNKAKKDEKKRGASLSRSVSRSLSAELEDSAANQ